MELWLANAVSIFAEINRVLRDDGTLWINIGDTYATDQNGRPAAAVRTPEAEAPAKPARTRVSRPRAPRAVSEDGTPAPTRSRRKPVAEAERPAPVRPEGDQD